MGTVTRIPSSEAILRGLAEKLNPHAPAPTLADLAAWVPRSPAEVWQALGVPFTPRTAGDPDRLDRLVISLHESYVKWCEGSGRDMKAEWREHPVLAFVAGWQQREVVVKPTRGAGLPRFQRVSESEALALPGFDAPMPGPIRGQQVLPGFDVTPVGGCPSWLLSLYDQAGGETERPGRGAPLDLPRVRGARCCPYQRPRAMVATSGFPSPLVSWPSGCIPMDGIGPIAAGVGSRSVSR